MEKNWNFELKTFKIRRDLFQNPQDFKMDRFSIWYYPFPFYGTHCFWVKYQDSSLNQLWPKTSTTYPDSAPLAEPWSMSHDNYNLIYFNPFVFLKSWLLVRAASLCGKLM